MSRKFYDHLESQISEVRAAGLYKSERVITSPQGAEISVRESQASVLNLCANNYLGLSGHPEMVEAAKTALDRYGYGMSSVRFICGTQEDHKDLEAALSAFLKKQDTILYSSCFDANTGLFETLLDDQDAIISDALNHASIIDGVRLCKARRLRYANNDMAALEERLREAEDARFRLIATDGVFSMDGIIANLPDIVELARKHDALVMVDDSHAVGFLGPRGAGTPNHYGLDDEIDILTGTLGKALGGASGGYTSGRRVMIEWLRQRSRPYLFSNSLAPMIAAASLHALELLQRGDDLRRRLMDNTAFFRAGLKTKGFTIVEGEHPIIPVMLGDAALAQSFAAALLEEGIYVTGFSFPVVPRGQARIRSQMSAALSRGNLEFALAAFEKVGRKLGVIG
jgi:glycine C-acetyltransferase